MEKFKLKFNSDCRLSRNERREYERKLRKAHMKAKTISSNPAFEKIKPDLIGKGWIYEEKFGNVVESDYNMTLQFSPALRLVSEKFNITLIPHKSGIEISRLEVWPNYQNQGLGGTFLENLLKYLINQGIEEIYVIPAPSGMGKSKPGLEKNQAELERFFIKRGFVQQKGTSFFVFNIGLFKSFYKSEDVDYSLLTKNSPVVKHGKMAHLVKVHFEFVGECNRNFIEAYDFHSYECIKEFTKKFKQDLQSEDDTSMSIRLLLDEVMESNPISKELSEISKSLFGILMAEFAENNDYKEYLRVFGGILAGILFQFHGGIENRINAFCFLLEKTHHKLEVEIHFAGETENIINPSKLN